MKWLRDNAVLALGISLPLLLMLVFVSIRAVSTGDSPPPAYAALFTTDSMMHKIGGNFDFTINNDGHLSIRYIDDKKTNSTDPSNVGMLILYSPATGTQRFPISASEKTDSGKTVEVETPAALAALRFNPSAQSPDGYRLDRRLNTHNTNFITDIFGYNNSKNYMLTNGVRHEFIPNIDGFYDEPKLIGWVIPE